MHIFKSINKRLFVAVFLVCFLLLVSFYTHISTFQSTVFKAEEIVYNVSRDYLVNSAKCKIVDMDPFDPQVINFYEPNSYITCSKKPLLTYVTKNNNTAILHIDQEILPLYTRFKTVCSYASVLRRQYKYRMDSYRVSMYKKFENNIKLPEDFVTVRCREETSRKLIYENVHSAITINKDVMKRLDKFNDTKKRHFSVLLVGIDSVSRLNFLRTLPISHEYLIQNGWIALKGFNKIGDNTFPNLMAILTGYNQTYLLKTYNPQILNKMNKCPIIWKDFKKFGYVTAYGEDSSRISTFNYKKVGFQESPTDYYFRPYFLQSERLASVLEDGLKYCTGPESSGERMLNVAKDFASTFKNSPNFGLFWMNSFSHNNMNLPSAMDIKIKEFLNDITEEGVLENSIVVFLSDHGMRFGKFRNTAMGWLEERLPFIYVWIPESFRKRFPSEFSNLQNNAQKLTSPYDLYVTLRHLMVLSKLTEELKTSAQCPTCRSLFTEISSERSCQEAGIEPHWCTCLDFNFFEEVSEDVINRAAEYFLQQIQNIIHAKNGDRKCVQYTIKKVVKAAVTHSYNKETFFLLLVETKPEAFFETTLLYTKYENNTDNFEITGGISRTDKYDLHSRCTEDHVLKKYCYCRNSTKHNKN